MIVLNRRQRAVLSDKLPDVANVAAGALVFGQFLGGRPFSLRLAVVGFALWILFVVCSVLLAGGSES